MKRCGPFPHSERTTSASQTHQSGRQSGTLRPLCNCCGPPGFGLFFSRNIRDLQSCCGLKSLNIRCAERSIAARTRLSGELNALIVPGHPDALRQQTADAREARVTGGLLSFPSRERSAEGLRVPCPVQATEVLPLSNLGILS